MKLSRNAIYPVLIFVSVFFIGVMTIAEWSLASTVTTIDHSYKSILREIPLQNACVSGTEVRSIHPIRTCIELEPSTPSLPERPNLTPSWKCRQFANVQLVYPRSITTEKCLRYASVRSAEMSPIPDCLESEQEVLTLPKTIEITISTDDFRGSKLDVMKQQFTFPQCK